MNRAVPFLDFGARRKGDKNPFVEFQSGDWLEHKHQANQRTLGGDFGTVAALHYKNTGRRYCETCRHYKPRNARPLVKGWKCTDCEKGAA